MKFFPLLAVASHLVAAQLFASPNDALTSGAVKRDSNGYTNIVSWDKYSLILDGQRIFIHSGEFHPFRLPVCEVHCEFSTSADAFLNIGPRPMERCASKIQGGWSQRCFDLFPLVGHNTLWGLAPSSRSLKGIEQSIQRSPRFRRRSSPSATVRCG